MSQEIVVPGKSFGSVVAISEFAKVSVFLFLGAVAGGYMAFNISGPIESPIACRFRAGKVSAMGLDMFARRAPVRAMHAESATRQELSATYWSSDFRENCFRHSRQDKQSEVVVERPREVDLGVGILTSGSLNPTSVVTTWS